MPVSYTHLDVYKRQFYVLLLGTDGRPGEDTYRADSIILARIDPTQKQATLISVPVSYTHLDVYKRQH